MPWKTQAQTYNLFDNYSKSNQHLKWTGLEGENFGS